MSWNFLSPQRLFFLLVFPNMHFKESGRKLENTSNLVSLDKFRLTNTFQELKCRSTLILKTATRIPSQGTEGK